MFEHVPDLTVAEIRHVLDRPHIWRWLNAPMVTRMSRRNTARARSRSDGWSAGEKELTVQTQEAGGCTIIEVGGRMTIESSFRLRPFLHAAVSAAPSAGVVIDFTSTSYLDTSAAATLLEAAVLARDRGVRLRLVGLSGEPRLLAEVIELDRIFRALGSDVEFT